MDNNNKNLQLMRLLHLEQEMQNEELRRMQSVLEKSLAYYTNLYELAPVSYVSLTPEGLVIEINTAGVDLLGKNRSQLVNRRFDNYIVPEDKDRWHHHFLYTKKQNHNQAIDLTLCPADGLLKHVNIVCQPLELDNGIPAICLAITDISAHQQVNVAQSNLELLLNDAKFATWNWDLKTGTVDFNNHWVKMRGYQPEDIEPHINFWQQNILSDDLPHVQNVLTEYLASNDSNFTVEYRVANQSGVCVWVKNVATAIQRDHQGNILRIVGIETDITEPKQMENRLRIVEACLDTQIGILITDEHHNILNVNRAFTEITGYQAQEAIGRKPTFLQSELHKKEFYQDMWEALILRGYWEGEIWDKHKNGYLFPVWLTISVKNAYYVGSLTVMRNPRKAEKKLHDAYAGQKIITADSIKNNSTLNALLEYQNTIKSDVHNQLLRDLEVSVLPFLQKLKETSVDRNQNCLVNIIEANLQHMLKEPDSNNNLSAVYQKLTSAETRIASMIRQGLSTKVIAKALDISITTVNTHRKAIRKKLGLSRDAGSLYSYLGSLNENHGNLEKTDNADEIIITNN